MGASRLPRGRAAIAAMSLALSVGCAAPKALYDGPPLPRGQVALLNGFPSFEYRQGAPGKGNTVSGRGVVVVIGLDGKIFNRKVHAAYSGDSFTLLPGSHVLLAYCAYEARGGDRSTHFYSALFTIPLEARAGREYRYRADFTPEATGRGRHPEGGGSVARPGIWDVTDNRSCDSSNRVSTTESPVPVTRRDLSHLQRAID